MKRILLGISLLGAAAVLGGCPIYPSQGEYQVCSANECFSCPDSSYSNACTPWPCQYDSDCPSGYACDPSQGACLTPTSSPDGGSPNDCSVNGCPSGQICELSNGIAQCVTLGGSTGDASTEPDANTGPGGDGGAPVEASTGDASEGGTAVTGPCNDNATCGGNGEKCINGQCTTQVDLCSDGSQCAVAGSACVDGVCTPRCSQANPFCPTGQCNVNRGVCTVFSPCTGSGASTCVGGAVCVESVCVLPCANSDSGPSCPLPGEVCVNGGCIANQAPTTFVCANDGQSGQSANSCGAGEICIHHDCVLGCGGDSGVTCGSPTSMNGIACTSVQIETGTYSVCAAAGTMGSACDPAQGKYCGGGQVCVDGFCN
jgi:hypothetical protein